MTFRGLVSMTASSAPNNLDSAAFTSSANPSSGSRARSTRSITPVISVEYAIGSTLESVFSAFAAAAAAVSALVACFDCLMTAESRPVTVAALPPRSICWILRTIARVSGLLGNNSS